MRSNKYSWIWWLEWLSTTVLLLGCLFNVLNIYPANIYWCFLGNFGWMVVAIMWKEYSLIIIQSIVSIIYLAGIYGTW